MPTNPATIGPRVPRVVHSTSDEIAALSAQFRHFAAEVRAGFELLSEKVVTKLDRVESDVREFRVWLQDLERARHDAARRIDALEAVVFAPRKKTTKKKGA